VTTIKWPFGEKNKIKEGCRPSSNLYFSSFNVSNMIYIYDIRDRSNLLYIYVFCICFIYCNLGK